jgi:glutamate 5-kinase
LTEGIIPIANEDDAVSVAMSMFTDNDELASLVASLVKADMMILLTDIDGLYTGNPLHESSELLEEVGVQENVEHFIQSCTKKEGQGRGGMQSKVRIAKLTVQLNIPTIIANGKSKNTIIDFVINNTGISTQFKA